MTRTSSNGTRRSPDPAVRPEVVVVGGGQAGLAIGWVGDDAEFVARRIDAFDAPARPEVRQSERVGAST